ncbi:MAG: methylmalonyl Co-A mutase-associated GTPase MeaB [Anaerolineales bacterium]|nr:methylmalonyl Co-A mutase-associated GTPase MeaB [Anaerolineales bacterium]
MAAVRAGDRRALARLLTQVENQTPAAEAALAALFPHTGRAHLIGVTGAPGTGKSSLVAELAKVLRRQGESVAIVAVDPTSPFTGGAILGDRIRMRDLAGDPGVFIRSMASRGALGGLARTTADAVQVLDAAGFNRVIVETVGAGQSEVEIARTAQTVLVVEAPGLGDEVQGIKAGILEIADVLVVNKADLPGAETALRALRASLEIGHSAARRDTAAGWTPPIVATVAVHGQGLEELAGALDRHRDHLRASGADNARERARLAGDLESRLRGALYQRLLAQLEPGQFAQTVDKLQLRELDPAGAVRQLLEAAGPLS